MFKKILMRRIFPHTARSGIGCRTYQSSGYNIAEKPRGHDGRNIEHKFSVSRLPPRKEHILGRAFQRNGARRFANSETVPVDCHVGDITVKKDRLFRSVYEAGATGHKQREHQKKIRFILNFPTIK